MLPVLQRACRHFNTFNLRSRLHVKQLQDYIAQCDTCEQTF